MISKVLSIKVGGSVTRVCLMDYRSKNPRIYNNFSMKTPEGVIADGALQGDIKSFASALRSMIAEKNMRTKYVVFTVESTKIATREVKLPYTKANRVGAMVAANAGDYFPVDLANYQLSHNILGVEEDEEQGKKYKIQVLAAPRSLLDGYMQLAELCDLDIVAIDYAGNSVYQVAKAECNSGADLVMKVGETTTLLMVIEDSSILLSRTIPYGIDAAISEIQSNTAFGPRLSYEQAVTLARRKTCIRRSIQEQFSNMEDEDGENENEKDESEELLEAKKTVTEAFGPLINQINRMVDFYNSRYPKKPLARMYLTGMGGEFSGLSKLLTNSIGSKVVVLSKVQGLHIDRFFKDTSFGEYIENIGAAMAPINLYEIKRKKDSAAAGGFDKNIIPVIVFAVCMGVSLVLVITSVVPYVIAKQTNEHDKVMVESLRSIEPVYNEYVTIKAENEYLTSIEDYTWTHNGQLVEFIEEMESKMPSSIKVTSFTSNRTGFTIGMSVNNKKEAAKVITQFRTFNSVADVTVSAIADTKNESGVREVTFTLEGVYKEKEQMEFDAIEAEQTQTEEETAADTQEAVQSDEISEEVADETETDEAEQVSDETSAEE